MYISIRDCRYIQLYTKYSWSVYATFWGGKGLLLALYPCRKQELALSHGLSPWNLDIERLYGKIFVKGLEVPFPNTVNNIIIHRCPYCETAGPELVRWCGSDGGDWAGRGGAGRVRCPRRVTTLSNLPLVGPSQWPQQHHNLHTVRQWQHSVRTKFIIVLKIIGIVNQWPIVMQNKLALLWGGGQLCLLYVCLKKRK